MATKKYVNLLQFHRPTMKSGVYEVAVNQTLTATTKGIKMSIEALEKSFYVFGERLALGPDAIHSVYPPAGSQGEHSTTFPHLILNRSTLPWERTLIPGEEDIWLALLLFDEADTPKSKVVPLDEKFYQSIGAESEPGDGKKEEEIEADPISVIDVPQHILEKMMPRRSDLKFAAHSRREGEGESEVVEGRERIKKSTFRRSGPERAVVIGNRLPAAGQLSTVYLVSLENRFGADGNFDYSNKTEEGNIRLVSLKSWSFTSVDARFNFKGMLKKLDRSTLALPHQDKPEPVQALLGKGFLPMPHLFRKGAKAVSWYRGPLSVRTAVGQLETQLPAASADKLLVFDETTGMFDVSYAAAWQLGRLMALEDRLFSLELYQLKRQLSIQAKQSKASRLPLGETIHPDKITSAKSKVREWMRRRHILEQVPFHYLVPEEAMLPPESLRFFHIDPAWVRCLKDGAASIGRTTSADFELEKVEDLANEQIPTLSGFLLRSELVSGYPGLQIAGFSEELGDTDESEGLTPLLPLRLEKLAGSVLLCLFEGEVATVEFFQKPDVLHFGLDRDEDGFSKQLRHANGEDLPDNDPGTVLKLAARHWHANRLANFDEIANGLKTKLEASPLVSAQDKVEFSTFTSADFAMEMLEGVEKVRFTKKQVGTA